MKEYLKTTVRVKIIYDIIQAIEKTGNQTPQEIVEYHRDNIVTHQIDDEQLKTEAMEIHKQRTIMRQNFLDYVMSAQDSELRRHKFENIHKL